MPKPETDATAPARIAAPPMSQGKSVIGVDAPQHERSPVLLRLDHKLLQFLTLPTQIIGDRELERIRPRLDGAEL